MVCDTKWFHEIINIYYDVINYQAYSYIVYTSLHLQRGNFIIIYHNCIGLAMPI